MRHSQKEVRQLVKSIARGIRVCEDNEQVRFHWAGRWIDIDKKKAEKVMSKGVELAIKSLSRSAATQEFQRYGVSIENRG
jgi:hypothetical protein